MKKKRVLVIDVGGSHVKLMISRNGKRKKFDSGKTLVPRPWLLPTLGRLLGLDIYVEARKGSIAAQRAA